MEEHPRRTLPCLLRAVTELVENADETPPQKLSGQPGHSSTLHGTGANNRASPPAKDRQDEETCHRLVVARPVPAGLRLGSRGPSHRFNQDRHSDFRLFLLPILPPFLLAELLDHRSHNVYLVDWLCPEFRFCAPSINPNRWVFEHVLVPLRVRALHW